MYEQHVFDFDIPNGTWYVFHDFDPKDRMFVIAYNHNLSTVIPTNIQYDQGQITLHFGKPISGKCVVHRTPWEKEILWFAIQSIEEERKS